MVGNDGKTLMEQEAVQERVSIISRDAVQTAHMATALEKEGYAVDVHSRVPDSLTVAGEGTVVVFDAGSFGKEAAKTCRRIRRQRVHGPEQIVAVSEVTDEGYITELLEAGADDFIRGPVEELELQVRVKAAAIRIRSQLDLLHEREFYRHAVRQEEELSTRILNQNLHLRKAYEEVEGVNRKLQDENRALERIARLDSLSGLMNRMSLFGMMDVEIERATRSGLPLCGIMLDIDHFKSVNDNYGHGCGDEVIRSIGSQLKRELRKYDHAGRYGGEEFFMILPDTTVSQAAVFGERIRVSVESSQIECSGARLTVTASMGVSRFRSEDGRDAWITRADRAMYAAKQRGRNRVEVESSPR